MARQNKQLHRLWQRHKRKLISCMVVFLIWLFCLPKQLFNDPSSTVVTSSEGYLLGARIADDGQWRFPELDSIPQKFEDCILLFEDEYFFKHPGFNPISLVKAIKHNLTNTTRRGGSTITQQVIRLSRKNKKRTYLEKFIELFMATRLEARYSKKQILNFYATNAPFGGNVVGLETASWRYYGVSSYELSWGQIATLAVLPNAPSLIFPGKKEAILKSKRDRLLHKLFTKNRIDKTTYELAIEELLPIKPLPLPDLSSHLTEKIRREHSGKRIATSIHKDLQIAVNQIVKENYNQLRQNEVHNLAVLVIDVETKKVLAYVGNSPTSSEHKRFVNIIDRSRSTGSVLKPFLFAASLHDGLLLPNTLVEDVPTIINGYSPKNFDSNYQGAVPASNALSRSLNIPAVRMLRSYGLPRFYNQLKKMGFSAIDKPADHYGLSLILGGAESSLWEVTNAYAGMASTLGFFNSSSSEYRKNEFAHASYLKNTEVDFGEIQFEQPVVNAGAIHHVLNALKEVNRPRGQENWSFFDAAQPLAWKTGTSFGFKDAWAVGVTPKYAIGVWVGNADGEGRPGLTGIKAAAPVLFEILDKLPQSGWFEIPYDELTEAKTCAVSGYLAGSYCTEVQEEWIAPKGLQTKTCPYHKQISMDASGQFRVNSSCYPVADITSKNWFSLPPIIEYYYSKNHPEYQTLPKYLSNCQNENRSLMEFIFPKKNETLLIPEDFDSEVDDLIFKLVHQGETEVFWYLDDLFLGSTELFHELSVSQKPGNYVLTVVDLDGNSIQLPIEIKRASQ